MPVSVMGMRMVAPGLAFIRISRGLAGFFPSASRRCTLKVTVAEIFSP